MAGEGYSGTTAAHDAEEQRVKKRNKLILYIVLFAIFQVGIIAAFSLTIMKVRTPRFRVVSAAISGGDLSNSTFAATMNVRLSVKNANFGRYEFEETAVGFLHGGVAAGQATVGASRVNMRSTKTIEIALDLNVGASDLGAGILALDSSAKMRGNVEFFYVMKKKSSASMSCSVEIVVATKEVRNIACK